MVDQLWALTFRILGVACFSVFTLHKATTHFVEWLLCFLYVHIFCALLCFVTVFKHPVMSSYVPCYQTLCIAAFLLYYFLATFPCYLSTIRGRWDPSLVQGVVPRLAKNPSYSTSRSSNPSSWGGLLSVFCISFLKIIDRSLVSACQYHTCWYWWI